MFSLFIKFQISPDRKRSKMDTSNESETEETSALPSNNLEHFPIEILLRIFADIDDIGLLNLAITSCRFEIIAKVLFTERYADKYFTIDDESNEQQEIYEEQFNRFGSGIKAIKAIDICGIDGEHWMAKMLNKDTNRLKKLWFQDCLFKNAFGMLVNHRDITHLTITRGCCETDAPIRLPKYRNLRKLELNKFSRIKEQSLRWIFLHNPQMESLILRFCNHYFTLPKTLEYVHKHLKQLKEFIVLEDFDFQADFPSDKCIEKFLQVIDGLESFGLTIEEDVVDLFERISLKCGKNVKNLELYIISGYLDDDIVKIARTFENVETLSLLEVFEHVQEPVLSLVECLPKLRQLSLSKMIVTVTEYILSLLRKCGNLEKLVIELSTGRTRRPDDWANHFIPHLNANFHGDFLEAKRKTNVEIEFREYGRRIGRCTETEIVWRNKLMHRVEFNSIYSQSTMNLLDLAAQRTDSDNVKPAKPERKNPFDSILNYLDLTSLYALYNCNKRSKLLVEQYVQRHSQNQRPFLISDEFHLNYAGLKCFAPHVNNLDLRLFDHITDKIQCMIAKIYINLQTLCFRTRYRIDPHRFTLPNLQHYIFYGYGSSRTCCYYCNVTEFAEICPQVEIIEFRTMVNLYASDENNPQHSFSNLKIFKFRPCDDTQIKFAQELFAKNGTEIVILE